MAERILIKDGCILSMDPDIGTLGVGSVLIEDASIVRVAPEITSDARVINASGMIVMPGMVDTHRHTWQSLLRGLYTNSHIVEFFASLRFKLAAHYTADDAYIANYLGALEALECGVTTILDYSHCIHSPDHADALVTALRDAGIRAVYCYGLVASPGVETFESPRERHDDARRIAATYLSSDDGLLTRGVATTEMGLLPFPEHATEIRLAKELDAVIVSHTGSLWGSDLAKGIRELSHHDLLVPNHVHVHCNWLADDEWQLLADAGAKVSISPETELAMGQGRPPFRRCMAAGIAPSLSCDIMSFNSGDLLSQIRLGLNYQRWEDIDPERLGYLPSSLVLKCEAALEWATINGADACGLGSRVGSLTPGKRADVVIIGGETLNMMPRTSGPGTVVYQANAGNVRTVLVDGAIRKLDGRLVGVDLPSLRGRVESAHGSLLERAGADGPVLPPMPEGAIDALNKEWTRNIEMAYA